MEGEIINTIHSKHENHETIFWKNTKKRPKLMVTSDIWLTIGHHRMPRKILTNKNWDKIQVDTKPKIIDWEGYCSEKWCNPSSRRYIFLLTIPIHFSPHCYPNFLSDFLFIILKQKCELFILSYLCWHSSYIPNWKL